MHGLGFGVVHGLGFVVHLELKSVHGLGFGVVHGLGLLLVWSQKPCTVWGLEWCMAWVCCSFGAKSRARSGVWGGAWLGVCC